MRPGVVLVAVLAAVAVGVVSVAAHAAAAPTYTLTFQGSGTEHQVDQKQNIEDDGSCEAAEHVDVTATIAWATSWRGFRPAGRSPLAAPTRIDGSRIAGTHVKDACGLPLDEAPEGWAMQASCDDALVSSGAPQLSAVTRTQSIAIAITAPSFSVPVSAQCPLNVRNDQIAAHVVVTQKKLRALKRGASLSVSVGTSFPGPGDAYAPDLDCSVPTKPYEGYRTADHCQDQLSWSGSLKITRAS
ncbi:MAG: hypothetical protein QOH95_1560 [Gaiellaceae bacterium]|nr:hypothetical protein [Gaiellaceae bacterium]